MYRAATSGRAGGGKLHAVFRDAAAMVAEGEPIFEHWTACCHGVGRLLKIERKADFDTRLLPSGIVRRLDEVSAGAGRRLREALRAYLSRSSNPPAWSSTRASVTAALAGVLPARLSDEATAYLQEADVGPSTGRRTKEVPVGARKVLLRLGSIASVKGQTHSATLVVQTVSSRVSDVKAALEVAAGHRKKPTAKNPDLLKFVTNVFVGATRPRRLLCLALPENDLSPELRTAVEGWGWSVLDCGTHAA